MMRLKWRVADIEEEYHWLHKRMDDLVDRIIELECATPPDRLSCVRTREEGAKE